MTTAFIGPVRKLTGTPSINYNIVSADGTTKTLANNVLNPGDMVMYDTVNLCIIPGATASNYTKFVGIMEGQNPIASNIDNGTLQGGQAQLLQPVAGEGVAMLISTVGDAAYVHGQALTIGADAQHITNQSVTSNIWGYVFNPQGLTMPAADGVVRIPVRFHALYPTTAE